MADKSLSIENWRNKLGLFPMPLFQDKFPKEKFILLNGGMAGNLCLDYEEQNDALVRNYAWSSHVGHYLTVSNQNVSVFRWDIAKNEKYSLQSVENKLDSFYNYLKKQEINKQDSVIKFGIQLYRQIRTLLRDNTGNDSLNVLLYLFACIADNNTDRNKLNIKNWALSKDTRTKALEIKSSHWDNLSEILVNGLKSKGLQPDINLLLRHASGSLFQEAHFETLFPAYYQQTLEGFLPKIEDDLDSKNKGQISAHFTPTSIVRTIVEEALREFSFKGRKKLQF